MTLTKSPAKFAQGGKNLPLFLILSKGREKLGSILGEPQSVQGSVEDPISLYLKCLSMKQG